MKAMASTTTISSSLATIADTTNTTTTTTTTTNACLIEENIVYPGNDINDGSSDPKQNDAESCRSFCESNYPTAMYFGWFSPSNGGVNLHKTCWCKSSKAGRKSVQGSYSGEICRSNNASEYSSLSNYFQLGGLKTIIITPTTTANLQHNHKQ